MNSENVQTIEKRAFLMERRLKKINPKLHEIYRGGIFAIDRLLMNYKTDFPFFTDHTFQHSAQLINYCNILIGEENIDKLNADEIYILLMGACLHDVGMGISTSDFESMKDAIPEIAKFKEEHPDAVHGEVTRSFHNDLSAEFIKKYSALFEIPTEEHVYCIGQVSRGHRKNNLLDTSKFNPDYTLRNGTHIHLPYLTSLLKLADELDVTSDRNLLLDYENYVPPVESSKMCFKSHGAIKRFELEDDVMTFLYMTDEDDVREEIDLINKKILETFHEYESVINTYPGFEQTVKTIRFKDMNK